MDWKSGLMISLLALAACSKPQMPQEVAQKTENVQAPTATPKVETAQPTAETTIPADVAAFVDKRQGCDHFRGEEAYDEERGRFLKENMDKLCTGTDAELAALKNKYAERAEVMTKLSEYEITIE